MSNEMTTMNLPARKGERRESAIAAGLRGGSEGGNIKRISIKGGVWRLIVGGEEAAVNEGRTMNVVFVASAPALSRHYYDVKYQEGVQAVPSCWSDDGIAPSPNVEFPQSKRCADCEMNVGGSSEDGKSRACKYASRAAIVLEGNLGGDVYGVQFPATSVFGKDSFDHHYGLMRYVKELDKINYAPEEVVTEMKFDTKSAVPKIGFKAVRVLTEEEQAVILKQESSDDIKYHTGPRTFGIENREPEKQPKAKPSAAAKAPPKVSAADTIKEWSADD